VVAFDFAGIQARNVAMESKDKTLVKYFRERYDIHTDWMERIARHHPKWIKEGVKKLAKDKEVAKHYRQQAKNKFVFATFFGAGSKTTSGGLGVPESIGDILGREFKEEFPGVATWHKTLRMSYRELGYVTGLSGFRRRAPVAATEVINTPIQSDESVIVLDSLIRLTDMDDDRLVPNLEIHDDLTFIWDKDEVEELAEIVIRAMLSTSFEWAKIVPLGVEMSIGEDWASLEHVGEYYSDTWDGNVLLAA
jgi:DNA polymerase I-like protein with 3'-5' exonuclease and polymerase domains